MRKLIMITIACAACAGPVIASMPAASASTTYVSWNDLQHGTNYLKATGQNQQMKVGTSGYAQFTRDFGRNINGVEYYRYVDKGNGLCPTSDNDGPVEEKTCNTSGGGLENQQWGDPQYPDQTSQNAADALVGIGGPDPDVMTVNPFPTKVLMEGDTLGDTEWLVAAS